MNRKNDLRNTKSTIYTHFTDPIQPKSCYERSFMLRQCNNSRLLQGNLVTGTQNAISTAWIQKITPSLPFQIMLRWKINKKRNDHHNIQKRTEHISASTLLPISTLLVFFFILVQGTNPTSIGYSNRLMINCVASLWWSDINFRKSSWRASCGV